MIRELFSSADADPTLDMDLQVAFDILGIDRRRRALEHIAEFEGGIGLSDLSGLVSVGEYPGVTHADALSTSEKKTVYVSLYQCHLPKLADAGAIEWDEERGMVYPTESTHALVELTTTAENLQGDGDA